MTCRVVILLGAVATALLAQKYEGPRPAKPDIPYIKHADSLLATEVSEATEEKRKDDILYVVPGAESTVKTPLASPILLFQSDKIVPDTLQLFKLETRNGRREILFSHKKRQTAKPIRIDITRLGPDLYQVEVTSSLDKGEYSLSPDGSNRVFCVQVY